MVMFDSEAARRWTRPAVLGRVVLAVLCAVLLVAVLGAARADAAQLPSGFSDTTVITGLTQPTAVRFSPDGRVFVAEKSGLIKVFDNLSDTTPTVFADLRTNVHNFWDRGLLGMALDPNFPTTPYVYVLYTLRRARSAARRRAGARRRTSDACPTPPGADRRRLRGQRPALAAAGAGNVMTGAEQVLIEDWCQQYPSHSIGASRSAPTARSTRAAATARASTSPTTARTATRVNPCGDPPGGVGAALTPPTAEGGALRSQDLRTTGDPAGLDGSIIRVDPATGAALPDNPLAASSDPNARRIVAYGLRNPFRFAIRPGHERVCASATSAGTTWEEINRFPTPTTGPRTSAGRATRATGRRPATTAAI